MKPRTVLSLSILAGMFLLPAFASEQDEPVISLPPPLPPAAQEWKDVLTYVGQVGGLHAWTIRHHGGLVFRTPDGVNLILGNIYGSEGQDLTAAYNGMTAYPLSSLMGPVSAAVEPALAVPDNAISADSAPASSLPQAATAVSGEEARPSMPANPFLRARETSGSAGADTPEGASGTADTSAMSALPATGIDQVTLEQIGTETFWMIVGNQDAPAVYALIDPTCPFCGRAMVEMQEAVEKGEIHLRVVLTPFRERKAVELAAAILTDEAPPVAFWRHETEFGATGRDGIAPVEPLELGLEGLGLLEHNVLWMRDRKIPGVPFFAWKEESGWKNAFGVTRPDSFASAVSLPPPDSGFLHFPPGKEVTGATE